MVDRRHFIGRAALWAVGLAGTLVAAAYLRRFFPRIAGEKRRIPIGDPGQYPVDTYTFIAASNLFIYRDHEGIKAVSAVCTHLGCILEKSTEGFRCPCHGSCYSTDGKVISGPAPSNLAWYRVERTATGTVFVDRGKRVPAGEKFLTS